MFSRFFHEIFPWNFLCLFFRCFQMGFFCKIIRYIGVSYTVLTLIKKNHLAERKKICEKVITIRDSYWLVLMLLQFEKRRGQDVCSFFKLQQQQIFWSFGCWFFVTSCKVRIFWEGHKIWKNLPLKIWRYSVTSNF